MTAYNTMVTWTRSSIIAWTWQPVKKTHFLPTFNRQLQQVEFGLPHRGHLRLLQLTRYTNYLLTYFLLYRKVNGRCNVREIALWVTTQCVECIQKLLGCMCSTDFLSRTKYNLLIALTIIVFAIVVFNAGASWSGAAEVTSVCFVTSRLWREWHVTCAARAIINRV